MGHPSQLRVLAELGELLGTGDLTLASLQLAWRGGREGLSAGKPRGSGWAQPGWLALARLAVGLLGSQGFPVPYFPRSAGLRLGCFWSRWLR